ncbi:MAG: DNA-directed RNA polymerase subunit beta' [Candidatus Hodgkinia cicadicola]
MNKLNFEKEANEQLLKFEPDLVVRPLASSEEASFLSLSLASPETILSWSYGEISNSNLFDSETGKPVAGGLFCPRVFGPTGLTNTRECLCGKPPTEGIKLCAECGVDLSVDWKAARSRFGHIELKTPVVHTWFHKSMPNILALLTGLTTATIRKLVSYELHIVFKNNNENNDETLDKKSIVNTQALSDFWHQRKSYKILCGGHALLELLSRSNLTLLRQKLKAKILKSRTVGSAQKSRQKLEILSGFIDSEVSPHWIVLKMLPVLPAELRPVLILDDNRCASSDLNELYARIIDANRVVEGVYKTVDEDENIEFSTVIEALQTLQRSVDELIDNASFSKMIRGTSSIPLKSLTELLKGKKGRFRQSLLGRRVDYSGRSVIAPGLELKLDECGLPREMAAELFKPFVYAKLIESGRAKNLAEAKLFISEDSKLADAMLEAVATFYPVLLNRAPTLHKLSFLAFKVRLINSKVIRLHPLVCSGFNADFDGDQMAVHIPLSKEARLEALILMMSTKNIRHPAHGSSSITPTQDMILGLYYMSFVSSKQSSICFTSYTEVNSALLSHVVDLHTKIKFYTIIDGKQKLVFTTPGRLLISEVVPKACKVVYDVSAPMLSKTEINKLVDFVYEICNNSCAIEFCENLMKLGFKHASLSGISLSKADLISIPDKQRILDNTRYAVSGLGRGASSVPRDCQQANAFWKLWTDAAREINEYVDLGLARDKGMLSSMQIMIDSGARGTLAQARQLMGCRGQVVGFKGKVCKMPVLTSFKDGLSLFSFFYATYSSRKGLVDTVLKTASSGYFTRKLVEVSREWIITELDCGTSEGFRVTTLADSTQLKHRLIGRILLGAVIRNGVVLVDSNELITKYNMGVVVSGSDGVVIRSPLMCQAKNGICSMCYGVNVGTGSMARLGDAVGMLAAQSISEPGTQLTLRTFHGSSFVEEAEVRRVVKAHLLSPCDGILRIRNLACIRTTSGDIIVVGDDCVVCIYHDDKLVWQQHLRRGVRVLVCDGDYVYFGKLLCMQFSSSFSYVSLICGQLCFRNIVKDVNISLNLDAKTGLTNYSIIASQDFPPELDTPQILIRSSVAELAFELQDLEQNKLLVGPGTKIDVFDLILSSDVELTAAVIIPPTEGLAKLSKLFDARSDENDIGLVAPEAASVEVGDAAAGFQTFTVDLDSKSREPVVFAVRSGITDIKDYKHVEGGEDIIAGEVNILAHAKLHGFNSFANLFISKVQEIYSHQGISLNSKHVEIVLRQMTNTVIVLDGGVSQLKRGSIVEWQVVASTNSELKASGSAIVAFERQIRGVTEICSNQTSILANVSFQGAVKTLTKAVVKAGTHSLSGIKDHIILGKLPPVGTGYYVRIAERTRKRPLSWSYESD